MNNEWGRPEVGGFIILIHERMNVWGVFTQWVLSDGVISMSANCF
jgi:hypothetical protein